MLLPTKLFRPDVPAQHVVRARLLATLDRGRTQELTLVAAPAGYGKTTLVAAWLKTLDPATPVGWVALDSHDNDPAQFWRYLLAALQQANSTVGQAALQSLGSLPAPPLAAIVSALVGDIWTAYQNDGRQCVLVLDDYHLIKEPRIHETLNQLLDYVPHQALRVILTTRADPPLKLARRRVRQQLCEIRSADLRFTIDEIAQFFATYPQLAIDDATAAQLSAGTEGWAAALQLAALSQQQRPHAMDGLAALSGSRQLVADYLLDEVLLEQPPALQAFLLQTAVLAQFSAELADDVLGRHDAGETLQQLARQNLFLVPLDNARRWVRYHHLFADLLRAQAEKQYGADHLRDLQRRAAVWYAERNQWEQAIDCAFAAGDDRLALAQLRAFLDADPSWLFVRAEWLSRLSDAALNAQPLIRLVRATLLFSDARRNQHAAMAAELAAARAAIARLQAPQPVLAVHLAYLEVMLAVLTGSADLSTLLDPCLSAFAAAPEDALHARGRLAYWIGLVYSRQNAWDAANRWLTQAQALLLAANDAYVYVMAHVAQWDAQIESGAATETTLAAIRHFKSTSPLMQAPHPITSAVHITEGTILMYRGELEAADGAFATGARLIQLTTEYGLEVRALWNGAFVRFCLGNSAEALALADTLDQRVPIFAPRTLTLRRWFTLPRYGRDPGVTAELDRWLAENAAETMRRAADRAVAANFVAMMELFLVVRLTVLRGNAPDLEALLPPLDQLAAHYADLIFWRRRLQVLVHRVFVLDALGRTDAALQQLDAALTVAHADLHRFTFIESADRLLPLLERLDGRAWTQDVIAYCRRYALGEVGDSAESTAPARPQPLIEPLTERELEIIALLAEGLTNKQIGARLHLSPNTVRVHTSNIYAKLDVSSRTQAAGKARDLALI